jgi:hypothetical protein
MLAPGRRAFGLARTSLACGLPGYDSFAPLQSAWVLPRPSEVGVERKQLSSLRQCPHRFRGHVRSRIAIFKPAMPAPIAPRAVIVPAAHRSLLPHLRHCVAQPLRPLGLRCPRLYFRRELPSQRLPFHARIFYCGASLLSAVTARAAVAAAMITAKPRMIARIFSPPLRRLSNSSARFPSNSPWLPWSP